MVVSVDAQPPVITANSSERVMPAMNGRTTSGASVWPTKMLAAADRDSGRLVPSTFDRPPPSTLITTFITRR